MYFCFMFLILDLIFVATEVNTFHTTILMSYMGECEILNPSVKFQPVACEIVLQSVLKRGIKDTEFLNPD